MTGLFDRQPDPITLAFEAFHEEHPEVYVMFCDLCDRLIAAGHERYSSDAINHRIRWHFSVDCGDREFKLNDHFTSRYARKWLAAHPQHAGFFELRTLRASEAA